MCVEIPRPFSNQGAFDWLTSALAGETRDRSYDTFLFALSTLCLTSLPILEAKMTILLIYLLFSTRKMKSVLVK